MSGERHETGADHDLDVEDKDAVVSPGPASTCIETIGGDPETALRLSFQIKVF